MDLNAYPRISNCAIAAPDGPHAKLTCRIPPSSALPSASKHLECHPCRVAGSGSGRDRRGLSQAGRSCLDQRSIENDEVDGPHLLQRLLAGLLRALAIDTGPFSGNPQFLAGQTRLLDSLADFLFISVDCESPRSKLESV